MSAIEILTCDQGSEEWHLARLGIPTASEFHTILAKGKEGTSASSVTRRAYMNRLAGEIITRIPAETYSNSHMERGKEMEPDARKMYAFMEDAELERVGFIRNGDVGCSPDSLVGGNGLVEIKTKIPALLIDLIRKDQFPPEHKAQCQGALWVAERDWIDIVVFWPGLPLFVKRATRDEAYIKTLAQAVEIFNSELAQTVEYVRRYGGAPADHRPLMNMLEPAGIVRREPQPDTAAPPAGANVLLAG